MRRAVALVLASLVVCPTLAIALDVPITGGKLLLKQSSSGKQKLVFQSKDAALPFPAAGGTDDPRTHGATIEVITPDAPRGGPFTAPKNAIQPGWTYKNAAVQSYKYKRDKAYAATTSIKGIVMKSAHGITIQGDATGIPLDGARGTVGIRITIGEVRSCARFTGASVTKDVVGAFLGKNATTAGFTDCEATSLTGSPPTCGDGDVNQPSEYCEGVCPDFPDDLTCRAPGTPGECSCCSDGWPSAAPCCNPSSVAIFYPPESKVCVPTGCTAPYDCRDGDECRPDESCCTTNNANLCIQAYAPPLVTQMIPLVPCCAGLECSRLALPQGAKCCASGGTTCAGDGDCCTGHCQLDSTCEACRAGGAGCGNATECCSGSCSSGSCNACATPGTPCTSNAACCSGTCANFQCQP